LDGSIAGAIVTVAGILFAIAFLFSPSQGLITKRLQQKEQLNEAPIS
jgi:manganese/zinc/iron transport system permease protein